jgi:chemotaxis regulatin CheY-phosphate phosphatase CheZ
MAGLKVPKDLTGEQYIAIEDSLLSSETGRAFLRMRDKRGAVLAIDEYHNGLRSIKEWIERANQRSAEDVHLEVLRKELIEMAASIRKAKAEISAMKPPGDDSSNSTRRINLATEELDAIVHSTERATTDILNSAERIMEISGRMRDNPNQADADQLDMEATNILMACGFQDITGQRISKVVSTLRYLEERVDAMIRIWGVDGILPDEIPQARKDTRPDAHLMHGPALHGGVDQSTVDELMNSPGGSPAPAAEELDWGLAVTESAAKAPEPAPAPPPPPKPAKAEKKAKEPAKAPEPVVAESGALDQSSIDSLFP